NLQAVLLIEFVHRPKDSRVQHGDLSDQVRGGIVGQSSGSQSLHRDIRDQRHARLGTSASRILDVVGFIQGNVPEAELAKQISNREDVDIGSAVAQTHTLQNQCVIIAHHYGVTRGVSQNVS